MEAGEVTRLLRAYASGDRSAFDKLVPLVYDELRRLARWHLRRSPGGRSLDTTGLVHEAYLKLAASPDLQIHDRPHLMAVSARAMRQVIVSRARARHAQKRGRGEAPEVFDDERLGRPSDAEWMLDLDRALTKLAERDEHLTRIFELRYFMGLSEEETAEALGVSLRTAQRSWLRARAWLRAELQGGAEAEPRRG